MRELTCVLADLGAAALLATARRCLSLPQPQHAARCLRLHPTPARELQGRRTAPLRPAACAVAVRTVCGEQTADVRLIVAHGRVSTQL